MGVPLITIMNRTAMKLGVSPIASPDENTAQALVFSRLYETVARTELRKQAWSFAMTRTSLPALSAAPAFGYDNAYQLPPDLLRLVYINDVWVDPSYRDVSVGEAPMWQIEGRQLLCDYDAPLHIRYVSSNVIATSEDWDDCFVDAFACALGMEAAPNLTKSDKVIQRLAMNYKSAMFEAKRCNAIELPPVQRDDGSWMTARL